MGRPMWLSFTFGQRRDFKAALTEAGRSDTLAEMANVINVKDNDLYSCSWNGWLECKNLYLATETIVTRANAVAILFVLIISEVQADASPIWTLVGSTGTNSFQCFGQGQIVESS